MSFSGISIVLLHGFFQDSRVFESVKNRFISLGFTVYTPDLLGFGTNNKLENDSLLTQNQLSWLVDYILSLKDEKLFICAYSMGARLALQAMKELQNNVLGFVIESGTNGIENDIERKKRAKNDTRLANMARSDFKGFQDYWMNHPTLTPIQPICFDDLLRLKIIQSEQNSENVALSLEQFGTAAMPYLNQTYFENSPKPVLFLAGENDKKFSSKANELATYNSRFRVNIIERCGHRIHLEKPTVYVDIVSQFINSVLKSTSRID